MPEATGWVQRDASVDGSNRTRGILRERDIGEADRRIRAD
jgi:hypothetical protein